MTIKPPQLAAFLCLLFVLTGQAKNSTIALSGRQAVIAFLRSSKMGKILVVMACLFLVGCNESKPKSDAVTISTDYQEAIHAQNDAVFEYERLARLAQREMLLSQH